MAGDLNRMRRCFQPWQWFQQEGEPYPFILNDEGTFMWVYRQEGQKFVVGYYAPDGTWNADSEYSSREEAAARVRYLMGGK